MPLPLPEVRRDWSPGLLGALALAGCGFLWSTAGLFIKLIDWNPLAIAGFRSLIAAAFLVLFLPSLHLRLTKSVIGAAVANAVTMLLFVMANKFTSAANAILLQYVAPVFTAVLGLVFLKEKIHWEQLTAFGFVIVGMVVLFGDQLGAGQWIGNLMALASGLTFAVMFTLTRHQKDGNPLESLFLSHVITALVGLVIAACLPWPVWTWQSLGAILALGVLQIGLAAVLFSYGIKRVSALSANLITIIEPVFNPVWVFLILKETPTTNTIVGGLIILVAVTVSAVITARRHSTA